MDISIRSDGEVKVLILRGRFDFEAYKRFRESCLTVIETNPHALLLQLTEVTYLDSSALGALLNLKDKADNKSIEVKIQGCSPIVREVLEVANFHRVFEILN